VLIKKLEGTALSSAFFSETKEVQAIQVLALERRRAAGKRQRDGRSEERKQEVREKANSAQKAARQRWPECFRQYDKTRNQKEPRRQYQLAAGRRKHRERSRAGPPAHPKPREENSPKRCFLPFSWCPVVVTGILTSCISISIQMQHDLTVCRHGLLQTKNERDSADTRRSIEQSDSASERQNAAATSAAAVPRAVPLRRLSRQRNRCEFSKTTENRENSLQKKKKKNSFRFVVGSQ
jgi:hypothetical protein